MENSQHDEAQRIIAILTGALDEVVRELVKAQITEMAISSVHLGASDYLRADTFDISDYLDESEYLRADSFDINDYTLDVSELDLSDAIDRALRDMLNDDALVVRLARFRA